MAAFPRIVAVRVAAILTIIIAGVWLAASLPKILTTPAPDFAYYYEAGQELTVRSQYPRHLLPPMSVLAYTPLAFLPYPVSQAVWVLGSVIALFWVIRLLMPTGGIRTSLGYGTVIALALLSFPVKFTLGMGQVNLFCLLLIVLAVTIRNQLAAGVALAISVLLKTETAMPAVMLILTGRNSAVLSMGASLAAATVMAGAVFGWESYPQFAERVAERFGTAGLDIYYNQSLAGTSVRFGLDYPVVLVSVSALVLGITAWVIRKRNMKPDHAMWLMLAAFVLAEPIAWQHHFVFLIPAFLYAWKLSTSNRQRLVLALSYGMVSWNFSRMPFPDTMPLARLLESHGTVGGLLLWGYLVKKA